MNNVSLKNLLPLLVAYLFIMAGCGTMQSIVKSSFPYTTTLVVPASAKAGTETSAVSTATSFDQNFSKSGNNAANISQVRIISAKLQSTDPSDFNLGNIASAKIYIAKANGSNEVLVASRTDIGPNIGNSLMLDIDNSHFLDEHVREPNIRVRMVYKMRNNISVDASLRVVLSMSAYPAGQ
jgi:hypothetical protein